MKPWLSHRWQMALLTLASLVLVIGLALSATMAAGPELTAETQQLPHELVEELRVNPPSRGTFGDRIFCRVDTRPMQASIPYCVCYGARACGELSISGRCNSRLGWFNQGTMAACRANGNQPYGAPEPVTITG